MPHKASMNRKKMLCYQSGTDKKFSSGISRESEFAKKLFNVIENLIYAEAN